MSAIKSNGRGGDGVLVVRRATSVYTERCDRRARQRISFPASSEESTTSVYFVTKHW